MQYFVEVIKQKSMTKAPSNLFITQPTISNTVKLLEEERQINYSFDTATNNKQNISPQEVTFTEESQNINQQQKNVNQLK